MNLLETAERIGVKGFLHCNEFEKLVELAENRDVLEIGAFMGLSAWGMALTAKTITSIDTFRANSAGQQQMSDITTLADYRKAVARYSNVTWYIGTSAEISRTLHGEWDMIFLDAMHTYESVLDDIDRWWPRVKPGGIMVFHDYYHDHFPGVAQAVNERFGELPNRLVTLGWLSK